MLVMFNTGTGIELVASNWGVGICITASSIAHIGESNLKLGSKPRRRQLGGEGVSRTAIDKQNCGKQCQEAAGATAAVEETAKYRRW